MLNNKIISLSTKKPQEEFDMEISTSDDSLQIAERDFAESQKTLQNCMSGGMGRIMTSLHGVAKSAVALCEEMHDIDTKVVENLMDVTPKITQLLSSAKPVANRIGSGLIKSRIEAAKEIIEGWQISDEKSMQIQRALIGQLKELTAYYCDTWTKICVLRTTADKYIAEVRAKAKTQVQELKRDQRLSNLKRIIEETQRESERKIKQAEHDAAVKMKRQDTEVLMRKMEVGRQREVLEETKARIEGSQKEESAHNDAIKQEFERVYREHLERAHEDGVTILQEPSIKTDKTGRFYISPAHYGKKEAESTQAQAASASSGAGDVSGSDSGTAAGSSATQDDAGQAAAAPAEGGDGAAQPPQARPKKKSAIDKILGAAETGVGVLARGANIVTTGVGVIKQIGKVFK